MKIYDTLIIGSGYFSVGFALKRGNTLICERNELCDTGFYGPMRGFKKSSYIAETVAGKEIDTMFEEHGLYCNGMQNVNNFECAFCSYIKSKNIEVFIKTTVIETVKKDDGLYHTTLHTNSGFEYVCSWNIINTTVTDINADKYLSVLFYTDLQEKDLAEILKAFPGSVCEKAFYDDRYVVYIPANNTGDINVFKRNVLKTWSHNISNAKILYLPPVYGYRNAQDYSPYNDSNYTSPIEAIDAGYKLAERM